MIHIFKKHYFVAIFLFIYFAIIAYKLISYPTPFYDWDEAINVQVAKEMIEQKSFIPLWQGNFWLDKPPFPFIFFGLIMKFTPFVSPEILLRIISLILSVMALIFVYLVFLKVETSRRDVSTRTIAFLTVVLTAFTPIFLQRSQIVNLDVFLLIGWLGYLLFFRHFFFGLFFLAIAVLTKSLIGFYPVGILLGYYVCLFFAKKIKKTELKLNIKIIFFQVGILSIWYFGMFLFFGKDFWQQHIIETHFRRVTASIESHFGAKTYYMDLMFEQLGFFAWLSLFGLLLILWRFLHKKLTNHQLTNLLFLFPWFIFLNLTKTKIFWYLYPAVPQFAFLVVYPLTLLPFRQVLLSFPRKRESSSLLNRFRIKYGMTIVGFVIIAVIFYQNFIKTNFFTTFYSKPEDHYRLALYAKYYCDSLTVLVGKETREAIRTLEGMGLTISSTKQWGDYPSLVYYFGRRVNFEYDENNLEKGIKFLKKSNCLAIRKDDVSLDLDLFNKLKNFNSLYLYKK